jgi:hypothetical protein
MHYVKKRMIVTSFKIFFKNKSYLKHISNRVTQFETESNSHRDRERKKEKKKERNNPI